MPPVQRPKGTRDFLPRDMERRRWLEGRLREVMRRFAFREVGTPAFEHTELFTLRSGPSIVEDMYTFTDKGGREMALRPELTAPTMRLYAEGLLGAPRPLKLCYFGNCFRYEQPQKGRYREFWQFGAEILGAERASGETEILALAHECLRGSGVRDPVMRIGHVGVLKRLLSDSGVPPGEQPRFWPLVDKKDFEGLRAALGERGVDPDPILSVLERRGGRELLEKVPGSGLEEVLDGLESMGVTGYTVDPGIARGLDYYTGMVFEIDVPGLGAEKQVCGGGSYSLAELFGAGKVESTGFALGFDRILVALEAAGAAFPEAGPDFFVVPVGPAERGEARRVVAALRRAGRSAETDLAARNLSKALKHAASAGASEAVIIGEDELGTGLLTVKNMGSGEQRKARLEELLK
ncbi:MAG: histidine--tRNA ligase [Euryarchaeota archaeon]|nr:histidine--tRNA ligase [Euryarchaeota archaeon]